MSEQSKAVHRNAYHAAVIERDRDAVNRYVAAELADRLWQSCQVYLTAFPDLHVVVEDVVAEGDRVAARLVWTGTQDGDLPGLPASGRAMAVDSVDFAWIRDGKIVELWTLVDRIRMMEQLQGGTDASAGAPAGAAAGSSPDTRRSA
jgi:steroid delta-isomerase-like uncharacterized protein